MTYTKEERAIICLDSFGLEYPRKAKLYKLAASAQALFENFRKYRPAVAETAGEETAEAMERSLSDQEYTDRLLHMYSEKRIECVTFVSEKYPEELRQISDPPLVLYCRGNTDLLSERKFAIVGSRRTLPQVMKRTEEFAEGLSSEFVIVTGLADGGDSAALGGALNRGRAISVLAYGFDHVYPGCNRALLERVEGKGLAVSEYLPQQKPLPYHFPMRNRIIAGLSEGVLVVSGGEKSGTRITAAKAYEYGRDVFAFPYSIGVPSGVGCNALIKEYAKLTENLVDIYAAFGINLTETEKISLSAAEQAVYEILREGEAHITEIAQKSGLKMHEVPIVLTMLEMKKLAVSCGGNRWAAAR